MNYLKEGSICDYCNRLKLRAEEQITVLIDIDTMRAIEDSKRTHYCRWEE